jgi:phage tail-like protein
MADTPFVDRGVTTSTFLLEVDGKSIGWFQEVQGLTVDVGVETIPEGGQNGFEHKFPGRMTWPDLTFKRGITQSDSFFDWLNKSSGEGFAGAGNKLKRSTAAITLVDPTGKRVRTWEVEGAFPIKWSGPQLSSEGANAATEEIVVAHHGFTSKKPGA